MNEKELPNQEPKKLSSRELAKRKKFLILAIIITIVASIFLFWNYHSPVEKTFELEKEGGKIKISNLSRDDIENIDWQEIKWIPCYHLESRQYFLVSKTI